MATSGGDITIKWTLDQALPVFSIELFHTGFNNAIAVANNVNSEAGMIKIQLPSVPPAEDYFFQFVNITNISQVYGTSSNFSIAAPASTSESSTMSNIMTATSDMETMGTSGATATMPASSELLGPGLLVQAVPKAPRRPPQHRAPPLALSSTAPAPPPAWVSCSAASLQARGCSDIVPV
ncbi:hypothetical protein B0H10DRAFT_508655 [Mycena sp. CBHHK59/15]|nr:hypothetical protein B0H10DRAFT_508655 [Mycena sp. CBHHK59/15]